MRLINIISLSFKKITQEKVRTLITTSVLSLILSLVYLLVNFSIGMGSYLEIEINNNFYNRLLEINDNPTLTYSDLDEIKTKSGIDQIIVFNSDYFSGFSLKLDSNTNILGYGRVVDVNYPIFSELEKQSLERSYLKEMHFILSGRTMSNDTDEIIISNQYFELNNLDYNDFLNKTIEIITGDKSITVKIVGVFNSAYYQVGNKDTIQVLFNQYTGIKVMNNLNLETLQIDEIKIISHTVNDAERLFGELRDYGVYYSSYNLIYKINNVKAMFIAIFGSIACIVLIFGIGILINTLRINLTEQSYFIGLLKTVGCKNSSIKMFIHLQGIFIIICANLFGFIISRIVEGRFISLANSIVEILKEEISFLNNKIYIPVNFGLIIIVVTTSIILTILFISRISKIIIKESPIETLGEGK